MNIVQPYTMGYRLLWILLKSKPLKLIAELQQIGGVLSRSVKGLMSKAKWFVVRKPSTGEIIATSANQIVLSKFREVQKCCTIFT